VVVGVLAASLMGACRSDGSDAKAKAAVRPKSQTQPSVEEVCRLVTPSELEAVLGAKVGKGQHPTKTGRRTPGVPGMQFCRFDDEAEGHALLGLSWSLSQATFKQTAESWPDVVRVHNLGDEAAFGAGILLVRQGRYLFLSEVEALAPEAPPTPEEARRVQRERMTLLALKALARLPKHDPARK